MSKLNEQAVAKAVSADPYVGRGIIIGQSEDRKNAVFAYFIMGRSENSRNRVFEQNGEDVTIFPHDSSKVADPSLIIYSPIRKIDNQIIVTNGDQTDTIFDFIERGDSFENALRTRCFEPDEPNFTPRISGILDFSYGKFTYKLSILKSIDDAGVACSRQFFEYPPIAGLGHFIHTYKGDGNPLPTFEGEPEAVKIGSDIDDFAMEIWENLDENNKISLFCEFVDLKTNKSQSVLINKNQGARK